MQTDPIPDTMCAHEPHSKHQPSDDRIDSRASLKSAGGAATSARRFSNLRIALALAVIGAFAAAVPFLSRTGPADDPAQEVAIEQGHLRFEYHPRTGASYLWDLRVPERDRLNRIRDLPDDAARMRLELERKLCIKSLDELHEPHRAAADRLRELGYL